MSDINVYVGRSHSIPCANQVICSQKPRRRAVIYTGFCLCPVAMKTLSSDSTQSPDIPDLHKSSLVTQSTSTIMELSLENT
jgi:hypothetical protein